MRSFLAAALAALLVLACSSSPSDSEAAHAEDAGPEDAGAVDGGTDAGTPDAATCLGACQAFSVEAQFGSVNRPFERAQFGLTAPDPPDGGGAWELHLELHAGGNAACPTQQSPTPNQTVIIAGLRLPLPSGTVGMAEGLRVNLLDFQGSLTTAPLLKSTAATVTLEAANVCESCTSDEMFLALALEAQFDGGTIGGHVYATHCPSLDLR